MAGGVLEENEPTSRISQASFYKLPPIELSSIIGISRDPMETYFFLN
jgi:hypothetical protein